MAFCLDFTITLTDYSFTETTGKCFMVIAANDFQSTCTNGQTASVQFMTVDPGASVTSGTKGMLATVTCGSTNLLNLNNPSVQFITESDSDPNTPGTLSNADEYSTLTLAQADWAQNDANEFTFNLAIKLASYPDVEADTYIKKDIYYSYKDFNQNTMNAYT